jgi:hypothetical protein
MPTIGKEFLQFRQLLFQAPEKFLYLRPVIHVIPHYAPHTTDSGNNHTEVQAGQVATLSALTFAHISRARQQARSSGMKPADIATAITKVRGWEGCMS